MFLGRERELLALEKMYDTPGFQMVVVYGRRRIGKTSLLNEFIKGKNSLYFPAEEVNDMLNLKKLSGLFAEKIGISPSPTYENWKDILSAICNKYNENRLVFIIDEYPYAANANGSLSSILQHLIDYEYKNTNIFLVLCGSSVSFMENHVLGEKSPLFGRRTGQLKLGPLDYYDAAKFFPDISAADKVRYFATVGGTPYYLSLINRDCSFEDNLNRLYFEITGYLFNEGTLLMKQEFREPANYNAVLQAIAAGHVSLNEIVQFTRQESNIVSKYLITLQELHLVERVIPFGANPLRGKTSQYRISENFLSFWYRYVFSVRAEIERGNGELYLDVAIDNMSEYFGQVFEEICRQYLRRLNQKRELPFIAKSFGRWWGKDKAGNPQDVDVVVDSLSGKKLILGECKWRDNINQPQVLQTLAERAKIFSDYETEQWLFVKSGKNDKQTEKIITADNLFL
ncbi:MAG: ATP-binding protein [Oscillospiraceae bacterium]|nr:ATP-binding protein [Oscillospiraceae bacterium]MCL2278453.1 ATP-binding protein [Oscillospiraceae bacterium]